MQLEKGFDPNITMRHWGERCVCVCVNLRWPWSTPELIPPSERREIQSMLGSVVKATISLISNLTHLKYCRQSLSWNPFMWKEQSALGLALLFWHAFCLVLLSLFTSLLRLSSLSLYLSFWMTCFCFISLCLHLLLYCSHSVICSDDAEEGADWFYSFALSLIIPVSFHFKCSDLNGNIQKLLQQKTFHTLQYSCD